VLILRVLKERRKNICQIREIEKKNSSLITFATFRLLQQRRTISQTNNPDEIKSPQRINPPFAPMSCQLEN